MSTTKIAVDLQTTLQSARDRAAVIEEQARAERIELEQALQLARGTGDLHVQAAAAVAKVKGEEMPRTLTEKIERALRAHDMSFEQLVKDVGEPAGRVQSVLSKLRKAGQVYNIGTGDRPRWLWVIGDDTAPEILRAVVTRLIRKRSFMFAELLAATGARRGRVSGVIVDLQRTGADIVNEGTERLAKWRLRD